MIPEHISMLEKFQWIQKRQYHNGISEVYRSGMEKTRRRSWGGGRARIFRTNCGRNPKIPPGKNPTIVLQ
jgi:hypothetical protein